MKEERLVYQRDLASVISLNTRNNYERIHGLKYNAWGHKKDPGDPANTCIKSVSGAEILQ